MKKIKTYIVFKEYPVSELIVVYYIGKSKRAARKEFRKQAFIFLPDNNSRTVKLKFISVDVSASDYDYLLDNSSNLSTMFDFNNYFNNVEELSMINDKTFELDFLPYYYDNTFRSWLKKYIKKHF